jgi:hypothetical protein
MAMLCTEFLERYSDYRDGRITDQQLARRLHDHLAQCPRCMKYDALVSRGVIALRATGDVPPSWRFRNDLRKRLAADAPPREEQESVKSAPAGIMAGLMVAGTLLLLGWAGTSLLHRTVAREPVPTAQARAPVMAVANPSAPFVTFTDLRVPAFHSGPVAERRPELSFTTWVTLAR